MTPPWSRDALFYHVYPLGMCGAPARNDGHAEPMPRLAQLEGWIGHWRDLGLNALYLGPVFESMTHGYDTVDYFRVDRRLGDVGTLAALTGKLHQAGFRVILDAVFNHVGREFWAFKDVLAHGEASRYRDWFSGLRFDSRSPLGDPFVYDTWAGAWELVKLNLANPEVREHLLAATGAWIDAFGIDGLRLDAADVMDLDFMRELRAYCRAKRPDFWLMGEVVHGDYTRWANDQTLDATTNYEAYKGLYSSHNDRNYFEVAHSLDRQFGPRGLYRDLPLYAFADNHDVDRIASTLHHPPHLFPLHLMLFTMPGVPSIYYGSEWAMPGKKAPTSDAALRPAVPPETRREHDLARAIARLARVRTALAPLRHGDYRQLYVASEQLAYVRRSAEGTVVVAVNGSDAPARLALELPGVPDGRLVDRLNGGFAAEVRGGRTVLSEVPPTWGRVLAFEAS